LRRVKAHGSCTAVRRGLGRPYQPFVEALRTYLESCADDELARGLGRYPGELVRLVPELAPRMSEPGPAVAVGSGDRAVPPVRGGGGMADERGRPHADRARARRPALGGSADTAVAPSRHALGERRPVHGARDVPPFGARPGSPARRDARGRPRQRTGPEAGSGRARGLDASAVAEFVEAAAGHDLGVAGHRFAESVHVETAGNPFFVNEIVRSLRESGDLEPGGGRRRRGGERASLAAGRAHPGRGA